MIFLFHMNMNYGSPTVKCNVLFFNSRLNFSLRIRQWIKFWVKSGCGQLYTWRCYPWVQDNDRLTIGTHRQRGKSDARTLWACYTVEHHPWQMVLFMLRCVDACVPDYALYKNVWWILNTSDQHKLVSIIHVPAAGVFVKLSKI